MCVTLVFMTRHKCPWKQGITGRSSVSPHNCHNSSGIYSCCTLRFWLLQRRNRGLVFVCTSVSWLSPLHDNRTVALWIPSSVIWCGESSRVNVGAVWCIAKTFPQKFLQEFVFDAMFVVCRKMSFSVSKPGHFIWCHFLG